MCVGRQTWTSWRCQTHAVIPATFESSHSQTAAGPGPEAAPRSPFSEAVSCRSALARPDMACSLSMPCHQWPEPDVKTSVPRPTAKAVSEISCRPWARGCEASSCMLPVRLSAAVARCTARRGLQPVQAPAFGKVGWLSSCGAAAVCRSNESGRGGVATMIADAQPNWC